MRPTSFDLSPRCIVSRQTVTLFVVFIGVVKLLHCKVNFFTIDSTTMYKTDRRGMQFLYLIKQL
jgi:hypothetical protein